MKTFKKSLLAFTGLLMLLGLQSCFNNEDPPELPPITETGANTLGFRIDGEIWVPQVDCITCPDRELCILLVENSFAIIAERKVTNDDAFPEFRISVDSVKTGELFVENSLLNITLLATGDNYSIDFDRPGSFLITRFDTTANVVSGQFEFFMSRRTGGSVEITEGRFDVEIGHCR